MQLFKLKTVLHQFDRFEEFAKEFKVGERDLILTHEFLYRPVIESLKLPAQVIMQEKYGQGEPNDEMMNRILQEVRSLSVDRIIAVGGGTVIDTAKLLVLKGLDDVVDAFERRIPLCKYRELVIIPTTCGTGSEVTNISIAEIKAKHTKMGLADDTITADHAVLIPEFLQGLPLPFFLTSSVDALIHAVEGYVSPKANSLTQLFSREAIATILEIYRHMNSEGADYRYKRLGDILQASTLAGIAFGNAGVGAVHALSYPLGGCYHVPHGEANYQFFLAVFRAYQNKQPGGRLQEVNRLMAQALQVDEGKVYEALDALLKQLLPRKPLRDYGMKPEEVESFADQVLATQQRLLANNYVPLSRDEIRDIYQELY